MTITSNYTRACALLLLLVPGILSAQTDIEQATTTFEETSPWYASDRISGNLDVGDFVVGPGRSEISLQPGESTIVDITLTNRISDNRTFRLQVEDIAGTDDGSSAMVVLEGERGPYSIRDYISFPEIEVTLALGERARLPITISVPADAEPGGFYGSVLVSTIQAGSADSARPRNPLIARVGSHIFLTVEGEQEISGQVLEMNTVPRQSWFTSGPVNLGISYENSGSIHLNPYGELSITNMLGEEVGYVELEPWFVLPQSIRTREIAWDRELLFGRYKAVATVNRGYNDILDEVSVTFWVLPYKLIGAVFGGLFIIFLLIRLFFRTFEFKRKS